jgi:hypothetical protein
LGVWQRPGADYVQQHNLLLIVSEDLGFELCCNDVQCEKNKGNTVKLTRILNRFLGAAKNDP